MFHGLLSNAQIFLTYLVPFLLMMTVVVFFHELGHYFSARRHKVKIEAFSIGFGYELFGWTDRIGTRWKICLIPLGGYLKLFDTHKEDLTPEKKRDSLFYKPVTQRMEIATAGPAANYVLSFVLLFFLYSFHGKPINPPHIGFVLPDSPAFEVGLKEGDTVLTVNDKAVDDFQSVAREIQESAQDTLRLEILREGKEMLISLTPMLKEIAPGQQQRLIGIAPYDTRLEKLSFFKASYAALEKCYTVTKLTLTALSGMVLGKKLNQLSGPLGIAVMTKKFAERSVWDFLFLGAMISLALGIFNLLPIPALDGGHLAFYLIELIRGQALSTKTQERLTFVGFALLMLVFLFATSNDVNTILFGKKL